MKDSGAIISQESQDLLNSISDKYQFKLMENEREEFPFWMDIIQTIERHPWKTYIPIPKTKEEIFEYLIEHPTMEDTQRDDWRQLCSEKFNETAYVLRELSTQENLPIQKRWPISRWRDAIQAWTGENLRLCSWNDMAPIVAGAPEELYHRAAIEISWWVNVISERFEKHSDSFFEISRRILSMNFDNIGTDISMSLAINHPIGIITQALLDWYYSQDPNDNQKLPELVGEIFTELCDTKIMKFKYGRLQLATHAIPLFRSDKEWTKRYLIPLFDWNKSEIEAKSAWLGFLYSPRNYIPFMELIKSYFLETVNHYSDLGQIKERFAAFFTIVSLNPGYNFTIKELRSAMNAFPEDGLRESAITLVKSLESANNNRVEYWKNKILPFWKKVWPKSNDKVFPSLSEPLALLCIEAGPEFSSAVEVLSGSIHKTRDPYYIIHRLSESNLSSQFPEHALRLLFSTIKEDSRWISADKLRQCLNTIIEKRPDFRENPMYQKLDLLTRKLEI